MLNKNTSGVKKCEANQKHHADVTKSYDIYQLRPRSYCIFSRLALSLEIGHLFLAKLFRWPSDKANREDIN